MTPNELVELLKAFGPATTALGIAAYLLMTRRAEPPRPSALEDDISEMRHDVKAILSTVSNLRERVAHIEGKLGK